MNAEDYVGSGEWLAADALKGNTVTLTIVSVQEVVFDNESGKDTSSA